jgi:uroporphyrinogen decarboxylase
MSEYRALREGRTFLDLCHDPDLAYEVTMQPIRAFDLDAAIVFADILLVPAAMGMDLHFEPGRGPVFPHPIESTGDVSALQALQPEQALSATLTAIERLVADLDRPVLGFAGAPFTVACYAIEGQGSKDWVRVRRFMADQPEAFQALLDALADATARWLNAQIAAGAHAIQLFDTWAGLLGPRDFRKYALASAKRVFAQVEGVPRIYFMRDAAAVLPWIPDTGCDAVGLDWRVPMSVARAHLGKIPVQGNLDPMVLFQDEAQIRQAVHEVLAQAGPRGHIFNLGHGIHRFTPPEAVAVVVDAVRSFDRGRA